MRQGQQNRRGRGRGRKVQNPLSRNYESNGPDVKIRGTASHIAEKYAALARDAVASGDNIAAENYFQHAEHYNRIIMAAQSQMTPANQPSPEATNGSGNRQRRGGDQDRGGKNAATPAAEEAGTNAKNANANAEAQADGGEKEKAPARNGAAKTASKKQSKVAAANGSDGDPGDDAKSSAGTEDVPPDSAIA